MRRIQPVSWSFQKHPITAARLFLRTNRDSHQCFAPERFPQFLGILVIFFRDALAIQLWVKRGELCLAEPFKRIHVFVRVTTFLQEQPCVFERFLCYFKRLGLAIACISKCPSWPFKLWNTTGIGNVLVFNLSLKLHSLCAAPRYLPVMWQWPCSFALTKGPCKTSMFPDWRQSIGPIESLTFLSLCGPVNLVFGWLRSSLFCDFGHNTCLYYGRTPPRSQNILLYSVFLPVFGDIKSGFCLPRGRCGLSSFFSSSFWMVTRITWKRRRRMFRRRFSVWLCKRTCMPLTVELPSLGGAQLWSFLNKHSKLAYITKRASSAHGSLWKTAQFLLVFSATLRIRVCAFQVASFFGIPANSVHRNVFSPYSCFGQTGER